MLAEGRVRPPVDTVEIRNSRLFCSVARWEGRRVYAHVMDGLGGLSCNDGSFIY